MTREKIRLDDKWKFVMDPSETGLLEQWFLKGLSVFTEVEVPHTFNVMPEGVDYRGSVWYEYDFEPAPSWAGKRVRFQFNGVYRDTDLWLNGEFIGKHYHSGYTTFQIDTNGSIRQGKENKLVLRVQNQWSSEALPYKRSFDWADDGGIFRDVFFIVTGQFAMDYVKISAKPNIPGYGNRINHSDASVKIQLKLAGAGFGEGSRSCNIEIFNGIEQDSGRLLQTEPVLLDDSIFENQQSCLQLPGIGLENVSLWHFDSLRLYRVVVTLMENGYVTDQIHTNIGFREFLVQGSSFFLNGEPVRICGTEWMPGSNPAFGNAEPREYQFQILRQLKETNCVFTRFHWQQDEAIYDWCDQNGMLVQEEIPHWGKAEVLPGKKQLEVSKQQMEEMIASHYNHPSIVMWGLGNELDGQNPVVGEMITKLKAYTRDIDSERPVNYVTNTMFQDSVTDISGLGDVIMINDYIGTWHGNLDEMEEFSKIVKSNPDRALVVSEYGLCEPAHAGGDLRRGEIFLQKMSIYSRFPEIAGSINFCLNDYRTQMGEEGQFQLRRRVHGSTDLFGEPKPSYYLVRDRCSPIAIKDLKKDGCGLSFNLVVKDTLPCYSVEHYELVLLKENKLVELREIPILKPGESWYIETIEVIDRIQIRRANGFLVRDVPLKSSME